MISNTSPPQRLRSRPLISTIEGLRPSNTGNIFRATCCATMLRYKLKVEMVCCAFYHLLAQRISRFKKCDKLHEKCCPYYWAFTQGRQHHQRERRLKILFPVIVIISLQPQAVRNGKRVSTLNYRNEIVMKGVVVWEKSLEYFVRFSCPLHNLKFG